MKSLTWVDAGLGTKATALGLLEVHVAKGGQALIVRRDWGRCEMETFASQEEGQRILEARLLEAHRRCDRRQWRVFGVLKVFVGHRRAGRWLAAVLAAQDFVPRSWHQEGQRLGVVLRCEFPRIRRHD